MRRDFFLHFSFHREKVLIPHPPKKKSIDAHVSCTQTWILSALVTPLTAYHESISNDWYPRFPNRPSGIVVMYDLIVHLISLQWTVCNDFHLLCRWTGVALHGLRLPINHSLSSIWKIDDDDQSKFWIILLVGFGEGGAMWDYNGSHCDTLYINFRMYE